MCLMFPGGKKKSAKFLVNYALPGMTEFFDPFVGGCGIILALPSSVQRIWLNDRSEWVVEFWRWLKRDPNCVDAIMHRKELCLRLTEEMAARQFFSDAKLRLITRYDPLDFMSVNLWAVNAIVRPDRPDIASFSSCLVRNGWEHVHEHKVQAYCDRLAHAEITCGDYSELLSGTRKSGRWLLCDPPYLIDDHRGPIYPYDFKPSDQVVLANRLRECKNDWLLTIGDSRFSEQLYAGYPMRRKAYTQTMTHRSEARKDDKNKTELWIMSR